MTRRLILAAPIGFICATPAAFSAAVPEKPNAIAVRLSLRPNGDDDAAVAAKDLKITVNGKPVKPTRLGTAGEPLVLTIVLDLIGDLTLVDAARQALVAEIEKSSATMAILRAQDGLRVLADPGSPKSKLLDEVRAITTGGRAGLLDTISQAATLADSVLKGARVRAAVLYVTDGLITQYREDYTNPVVNSSDANDMSRRFPEGLVKEKIRQLKDELAATLAPVFIVHLNYQNDRLNEAYQTGLLDLAASTGGEAVFCRTPSDIAPAVARAFNRVATLQVLELDARAGKSRQFEFAVESPGRALQYRSRYVPPAAIATPAAKPAAAAQKEK